MAPTEYTSVPTDDGQGEQRRRQQQEDGADEAAASRGNNKKWQLAPKDNKRSEYVLKYVQWLPVGLETPPGLAVLRLSVTKYEYSLREKAVGRFLRN